MRELEDDWCEYSKRSVNFHIQTFEIIERASFFFSN